MKTNKNKHTGDLFGITPCLDCDGEGHTVEEILQYENITTKTSNGLVGGEITRPIGIEEVTCESCNGTGIQ